MKKIFLILTLALAVGTECQAMWPFTKTKSHTSDEQRRTFDQNAQAIDNTVQGERSQTPAVNVSGPSNQVSVVVSGNPNFRSHTAVSSSSQAQLQSHEEEESLVKTKLPLGFAIIFFSLGLLLLIFAVRKLAAASPAAAAALRTADLAFSKVIARLEAHISTETDPQRLALLNSLHAEANKQRGIVAGTKDQ